MTTTTPAPVTGERAYTPEQTAARDYMQAQKVIDALTAQVKPQKAIQTAALDTLTAAYSAGRYRDVLATITGCWNVALTFTHRTDTSVKWAKVVDALRPSLTPAQERDLDQIIATFTGPKLTRNVKS